MALQGRLPGRKVSANLDMGSKTGPEEEEEEEEEELTKKLKEPLPTSFLRLQVRYLLSTYQVISDMEWSGLRSRRAMVL